MRIIANLLSSLLNAIALGGIALLAVQNVAPVSLKFLGFESVEIAIGLLLAFSLGFGLVLGALLPLLWINSTKTKKRSRSGATRSRVEEFDEFDFEDE